ncbi:TetR/AcrR family transcriptional regulator [Paenibacillus sp. S150]|uniref:TetR/AcrR family transcriptional regulator n=1 Tax=Paenibacillus sp. S150 TaxID=2749826 RepID=UPI001C581FC8|nr:TetR/AcrR family transcriptional regulator [Paenibacillus sp. S150]MBW4080170.1 TetR/AcrR family transcriptional regulator [Paenibacillus sp. S150]
MSKSGKKEAIMTASLALFAERGFAATTMPMISGSAGVAAGTVYRYFDSKEALLNFVFRKSVGELLAALQQEQKTPPVDGKSFRERFRRMFYGLWQFSKEQPLALQFVTSSTNHLHLDDESKRCMEHFMQYLQDTVQWGQQEGELRPLPLEVIVSIVYGAFLQLSVNFRSGWLRETPELLAELEDCCWNAVRRN